MDPRPTTVTAARRRLATSRSTRGDRTDDGGDEGGDAVTLLAMLGGEPAFPEGLRFARPAAPPLERVVARLEPSYELRNPDQRTARARARAPGRRPAGGQPRRGGLIVHGRADAHPPGARPTGSTGRDAELHVRGHRARRGVGRRHPAIRRVRRTTTSCSTSTTRRAASTARPRSSPPTCSARRAIPTASRSSATRTACPSSSTPPTASAPLRDGRPVGGFGDAEVFSLSPTKLVVSRRGWPRHDRRRRRSPSGSGSDATTATRATTTRSSPGSTPACRSCTRRWRSSRWTILDEHLRAPGATWSRATASLLAGVPGISPQHLGTGRRSRPTRTSPSWSTRRRSASTATCSPSRCAPRAIDTRCYFSPPVHRHEAYRGLLRPSCPRTDRLASRVISLPLWRDLDEDAVEVRRRRRSLASDQDADAIGQLPRSACERSSPAAPASSAPTSSTRSSPRATRVVVLDDLSTGSARTWRPTPTSSRATSPTRDGGRRGRAAARSSSTWPRTARSSARSSSPWRPTGRTSAARSRCCARRRDAGVRRVVLASSSSVYGGARQRPTPETAPLQPRSPYAVSKLAGEHYARVFCRAARPRDGGAAVLQRVRAPAAARQPVRRRGARCSSTPCVAGSPVEIHGDGAAEPRLHVRRRRRRGEHPRRLGTRRDVRRARLQHRQGRVPHRARAPPRTRRPVGRRRRSRHHVAQPAGRHPPLAGRRSRPPAHDLGYRPPGIARARACAATVAWWSEAVPAGSVDMTDLADALARPPRSATARASSCRAGLRRACRSRCGRARSGSPSSASTPTPSGSRRCAPGRSYVEDVARRRARRGARAGLPPDRRPGRPRGVRRRRHHGAHAAARGAARPLLRRAGGRDSSPTRCVPAPSSCSSRRPTRARPKELVRPILERVGPARRTRLLPRLLARAHRPRQPELGPRQHAQGRVGRRRAVAAVRRGVLRAHSSTRSCPSARPPRPSWSSCSRTRSATSTSRWSTSWRCSRRSSASTSGARSTPASTKPFGYMRFTPGPGVGGHCLPIDPSYLSWRVKRQSRPHVPVRRAGERRQRAHARLRRDADHDAAEPRWAWRSRSSRILVLGLSYKAGTSDWRESPSLAVVERLLALGANVRAWDPHLPPRWAPGSCPSPSCACSVEEIAAADLVVVLVDHPELPLDDIAEHARLVLDTARLPPRPHVQRRAALRPATPAHRAMTRSRTAHTRST